MNEHPNPKDRDDSINWARYILRNPDKYVVLDTETTGLKDAEVLEIGITDLRGTPLLNARVKPSRAKRWPSASKIHGIRPKDVENERTFDEIRDEIQAVLNQREVIIYNAEYDLDVLDNSAYESGAKSLSINSGLFNCAMLKYARYVGKWNDYYNDYRWIRLPGGDHSAVGDCQAVCKVLKRMAESKLFSESSDIYPINDFINEDELRLELEEYLKDIKIRIQLEQAARSERPWWKFW